MYPLQAPRKSPVYSMRKRYMSFWFGRDWYLPGQWMAGMAVTWRKREQKGGGGLQALAAATRESGAEGSSGGGGWRGRGGGLRLRRW